MLRVILKSKLNRKNKIKAKNTWAVATPTCWTRIIDRNKRKLEMSDRTTRKLITT